MLLEQQRLTSGARPAQVKADLTEMVTFQDEGMPLDELRSLIERSLVPHLLRYDQPSFQSMFNAFIPDEARLGADIALDYNQGVTNWQVSPGGAVLEEICCQALCRLFGLGPESDATFMYSGTYSNQQALYLAIHRAAGRAGFDHSQKGISGFANPQNLRVLVSADAHFSLKHAVRMLGLGEEALIGLPVDANRRIDADKAFEMVDHHPEWEVICVVATSGTTFSGSVDPIDRLADLAEQVGAWFHVDGAYGYAYKLVPEWQHLFEGDTRADSITWDPHKQMAAPIPSSVLFLKEGADFDRMSLYSACFNRPEDVEPNPGLKSPPSTRPMSALPLVSLLRGQGLARVVADLRSPLAAIQALYQALHHRPNIQLSHEPDTGILCFRMVPPDFPPNELSALQRQLYEAVAATGTRSISTAVLDGEMVLRVALVSPIAQVGDLLESIEMLEEMIKEGIIMEKSR